MKKFIIEIYNNSNKNLFFGNIETQYEYDYNINNKIILPKNYFILTINICNNIPIIFNVNFNLGTLNVYNPLQKKYGSSIFQFNSELVKSKINQKIRFSINPNLPDFAFVKMTLLP